MKKVFLFLVATMLFAAYVNAQEVHGVESRMVCTYDCNPNGTWDGWGTREWCSGEGYRYAHEPFFAYEFTNLNSIPVSVEVELYHYEIVKKGTAWNGSDNIYDYRVTATKSFVLKNGESYVFKTNENGIGLYINHDSYYVKYKAYKLL